MFEKYFKYRFCVLLKYTWVNLIKCTVQMHPCTNFDKNIKISKDQLTAFMGGYVQILIFPYNLNRKHTQTSAEIVYNYYFFK